MSSVAGAVVSVKVVSVPSPLNTWESIPPVLPLPPPLEAKVIVSLLAFVVIVILLPATKVSVSVAPSATTLLCPDTAIFLNASVTEPVAVEVIVSVSVPGVVAKDIPLPAANVNTSVVLSATRSDWPETLTVWNKFWELPPETVEKDKVPLPFVVRTCPFVPSDTLSAAIPTELSASLSAFTASFAIFVVVTEPSDNSLVPTTPPTWTILALPSFFFINNLPS